jgi:redox-sensitive bicupin YhaK (pirin superfamily)
LVKRTTVLVQVEQSERNRFWRFAFKSDDIAAGMGFGEHGHDNMEVITIAVRFGTQRQHVKKS